MAAFAPLFDVQTDEEIILSKRWSTLQPSTLERVRRMMTRPRDKALDMMEFAKIMVVEQMERGKAHVPPSTHHAKLVASLWLALHRGNRRGTHMSPEGTTPMWLEELHELCAKSDGDWHVYIYNHAQPLQPKRPKSAAKTGATGKKRPKNAAKTGC